MILWILLALMLGAVAGFYFGMAVQEERLWSIIHQARHNLTQSKMLLDEAEKEEE